MKNPSIEGFVMRTSESPFVIVYDCETTGLSPERDRIIQLNARKCFGSPDGLIEAERRNWYINPGFSVPQKIIKLTSLQTPEEVEKMTGIKDKEVLNRIIKSQSAAEISALTGIQDPEKLVYLTGITTEFLADKPKEKDVAKDILNWFEGCVVAGYNNTGFDDFFLQNMAKRCRLSFHPEESIDIYKDKIAGQLIPPENMANYKLKTLASYFGFDKKIAIFHNAEGDTLATLLCYNELFRLAKKREQASRTEYKVKCHVRGVAYWQSQKYTQYRRLFVDTDCGVFMINPQTGSWECKNPNDRIVKYDTDDMGKQCIALTKTGSFYNLLSFRGRTGANP